MPRCWLGGRTCQANGTKSGETAFKREDRLVDCLKKQPTAQKWDEAKEQRVIKGRQARRSLHSPANFSDAKGAQLNDVPVQHGDLVVVCLRLTTCSKHSSS